MQRRITIILAAFIVACGPGRGGDNYDLVILGGRIMDPETELDANRNVGIADGEIVAISAGAMSGRDTVDAAGLVVAPGFIDLHAHGQDSVSFRLHAADGVTTALELEIGVYPVAEWLEARAGHALINYGATVSHPAARVKVLTDVDIGHFAVLPPGSELMRVWSDDHIYAQFDGGQIADLSALIARGIDEGGLGIGFGITYTPGASRIEILRLFELAALRGVPAFVHLRGANSGGTLGAFQEVISNAASTGASVHIVHMNSSADEMAAITLQMIRGARARGLDVTTEAYPYTAGSTLIESALFDSWEGADDSTYHRLQWAGTTERLTAATFRRYRAQGGWVVIHGRNETTNEWIVSQPDVMVASDGIPFLMSGSAAL